MFEVTTRAAAPYSSIVYVEVDWLDGTATRASGVIVGPNDVLTALHVVYDTQHGGWADRVTVVPAPDTSPWNAPYGEYTNVGQIAGRASNWDLNGDRLLTEAESAGDLALIGMTSRLGDLTGWLPVAQQPNDFFGLMAGYPKRGTGMMAEQVFADASFAESVYNINSGLGSGASGGPLLQTFNGVTSVAGVLSGGNFDNTSSTYAGLFGGNWDWVHSAMAGNDSLLGFQAPNNTNQTTGLVLTGDAGDNVLNGGTGWDVFTGGGGADAILGGPGTDTAVYFGQRGFYQVDVVAGGVITVADAAPGGDGRDTLHDVERVQFADIAMAFDTDGSAGRAYRLYEAVFTRVPDAGGLGFHMKSLDMGATLSQVAASFVNSAEFQAKGAMSNAQFVESLYFNALNRAPDEGGFAFHVGTLQAGASRADVVVTFSESLENQAALIGLIQNGMVYTVYTA